MKRRRGTRRAHCGKVERGPPQQAVPKVSQPAPLLRGVAPEQRDQNSSLADACSHPESSGGADRLLPKV